MAYVIGEVGCNHGGSMDLAQHMIEAASLAGADAVKFQTYQTGLLVGADDIREFCRKCELSYKQHCLLKRCCADNGVDFLSSAFDIPSLQLLADLGVEQLKVPSGQIHNKDYLRCAARYFKDKVVFMSTGMSTAKEWKAAYRIVQSGARLTVPMYCVTAYPVPPKQAHMCACREIYNYSPRWGYSDHTLGMTCATIAVALGAMAVEHHFYLDEVDCPDMPASFCIAKLTAYIRCIRDTEVAMGKEPHKIIQPCEGKNLKRRDSTRYSGNGQGKYIKGQDNGVSQSDILGNVSTGPEVPGDIRE